MDDPDFFIVGTEHPEIGEQERDGRTFFIVWILGIGTLAS